MRIQVPGFACRPNSLPAGRYGATIFNKQIAYFLTASVQFHGNDEPEVRVVILNDISEPRILPFSALPVRMFENWQTLLFSADAFIKVDPLSIETPSHGYQYGSISVHSAACYLPSNQGRVNLTTGKFDTPSSDDMQVSFRRWSLCLPDGDKVTELFTFGQP